MGGRGLEAEAMLNGAMVGRQSGRRSVLGVTHGGDGSTAHVGLQYTEG